MIIKPALTFLTKDTDAQLLARTEGILSAMADNAHYPTPTPSLAVIGAAKDAFASAVVLALEGGKMATAAKNARRVELVLLLRQLAGYVQLTCQGELTVLISSGFPIQKPQRQPAGVLPPPAHLTVTQGPRTGELRAVTAPAKGAAICSWRVSTATAPTVWVQTATTTAARIVFGGLTPGVIYRVEARVVNSAGPSDWTGPVAHMVI